jgi:hypothetical protein
MFFLIEYLLCCISSHKKEYPVAGELRCSQSLYHCKHDSRCTYGPEMCRKIQVRFTITGMNPGADKHPSMGYSFQSTPEGDKLRLRAPDQIFRTSPGPKIPQQISTPQGGINSDFEQRGITLRLRRDCSTTHFRNRNASLTKKWLRYYLDFAINIMPFPLGGRAFPSSLANYRKKNKQKLSNGRHQMRSRYITNCFNIPSLKATPILPQK